MTLRTPRTMRLAFQIWAYATPREWNVTITELAEELRDSPYTVRAVLQHKGWLSRIRYTGSTIGRDNPYSNGGRSAYMDPLLEDLHEWQ